MKLIACLALFITASVMAQSPQSDKVVSHRDLVYVEGGHERHKLDLYLPSSDHGPLPVLIWVHGGG